MHPSDPEVLDSDVAAPVSAAKSSSVFKTIQTRRTFEEVTDQVRELLFDGTLKPGDRLPAERDLAKLLGVGRPALREALRALEASGLIDLRKGKTGGAFISTGRPSVVSDGMSDLLQLSSISVKELFEARQWIQTSLARIACQRITDADLAELRANIALGEQLHAAGNARERTTVNIEFHNILARATRNAVVVMVIRGLTDALRALIRQVGTAPSRGTFLHRREFLKALEARDEDAAAKGMQKILKDTEAMYQSLADARQAERQSDRGKPIQVARPRRA